MKRQIIVINGDETFAKGLQYSLEQEDYIVNLAFSMEEGLDMINNREYDFILTDVVLPDGNGLDLLKTIRNISNTPLVVVADEKEDINIILALENGADDYIVKPFNILELKARIKAILRRVSSNDTKEFNDIKVIDEFTFNIVGRKVTYLEENLNLTGKEFDLFYTLASNQGKIYTREELLSSLWGYEFFGDLRTVDVHIRRLREKIENASNYSDYIQTKWGEGYFYKGK